ncbi:MAG TPA: hypothetical protein VEU62_02250 [Bryobacterales bacterium]|nr:hypothetical protein [Bryobacterales bacterium]
MKRKPARRAPAHTTPDGSVVVGYRFTAAGDVCEKTGCAALPNPKGGRLAPNQKVTIKTVNGVDTQYVAGDWNGAQAWQDLPPCDPRPAPPAAS